MKASWHLDQVGAFRAWEHLRARGERPGEHVVVGHLDTGITSHPVFETMGNRLLRDRGWDYIKQRKSPIDPLPRGWFVQPGHGTGTLGILAADHLEPEYRGIAPATQVVPVRVAPTVVLWRNSDLAHGIRHCINQDVQVITVSMGGVASQLWADAINDAYEAGVVVCCAAGNHFNLPIGRTPHRVVYPARFRRTLAVSGVTKDGQPYLFPDRMSGNSGPEIDLAACTPDVMWAFAERYSGGIRYGFQPGSGTSSATPQVAGAAAIWMSFHRDALEPYSGPQRVEACRLALRSSAQTLNTEKTWFASEGGMRSDSFGHGRLDVDALVRAAVPTMNDIEPRPADKSDYSWWRVLFDRPEPAPSTE